MIDNNKNIDKIIFPKEYIPFNELVICSNNFIGGNIPIQIDNNAVLLVGCGTLPIVWIMAPANYNIWEYIVKNNISLKKNFFVEIDNTIKSVVVRLIGEKIIKDNIIGEVQLNIDKIILKVIKESDSKAIIEELDMRPLGLEIYGDSNRLNVITTSLNNNSFVGVKTMIKIGK